MDIKLQATDESNEAQERVNMLNQKVDYSVPNIGPDDQTFPKYTVGTGQTKLSGQVDERKTLGLIWNYANDSFVFDLVGYANVAAELPLTKQSVLSVVARLFDPLGLLTPIIVPMKVLFQELCVSKCGWDSPLNDTSSHKFLDWIHELRKVSHIVLPRCYFQNLCGNVIARYLCGFCDASIVAFAAYTYLVIVSYEVKMGSLGPHHQIVCCSSLKPLIIWLSNFATSSFYLLTRLWQNFIRIGLPGGLLQSFIKLERSQKLEIRKCFFLLKTYLVIVTDQGLHSSF